MNKTSYLVAFIFLFISGIARPVPARGQCHITLYPDNITFTSWNETKAIDIDTEQECPLYAVFPPVLEVTIRGNTLNVSIAGHVTMEELMDYVQGAEVMLQHAATHDFAGAVQVYFGMLPPALEPGLIGCDNTSVEAGNSPGTIYNALGPSGGEGNYSYRWESSTDRGNQWHVIPGAEADFHECHDLDTTTVFRREVTSGMQTRYSNYLTINVTVPDPPDPPDPPLPGNNFMLTQTMLDAAGSLSFNEVDHFDGLGRPVQNVMQKAAPGLTDIVTMQAYDDAGRPAKNYLPVPVTTATGAFVAPATVKALANSFHADTRAFEETLYEPSPLNRVDKVYGPGAAWHANDRPVATTRYTNGPTGELSCALYAVASANSLKRDGMYAPGELLVVKTTGEDGRMSYTFTDKLGRVVLERVMNGSEVNDTYHVHDDFGNPRYVLPPSASDLLTATTTWNDENTALKDHAYIYKYDERNRCTVKKMPGCEPVETRYDKADRLTFSRDGEQRSDGEWTFHFYDAFGRPAVTGRWVSSTVPDVSGTVVKATRDAGGTRLGGYTVNLTLPTTVKLMTVNYYDDYSFTSGVPQLDYVTPPAGYDARFDSAKGLITGSRSYRLSDPSRYTVSAYYHDHRGRVVQTRSTNHLGGHDHEYFAYTFTGKVKQHQRVHSNGTESQTETYTYDYGTPKTNPAERLLSVKHTLNDSPEVTLAQYGYDEVGRIKFKILHEDIDTTMYKYNVRSWLTRITGTRFNQTLAYNTAINGITPTKALFNGNISAMKWKAGDETTERGYKFAYDGLDRLTGAAYGEGFAINTNLNRFNENVTYNDKMGNIGTLVRRGKLNSGHGEMDNLTYTYTGNQLTRVSDAVTTPITYENAFHFVDGANVENEYTYDANGNLKRDLNKNITSITYNSLNLPEVITFANGNTITYVYDAAGSKLSVAYKSGGTTTKTEYAGNKVYKNGTLGMILTEEGYATLTGSTPAYYYYLRDHQGNNRVVINQAGTVQQVNHYYPFGGLFGEGVQASNQPYRYNGKEIDRFQNLDLLDYGARHYDAALGRWLTMDPLAEKYYSISPYVYVANNPVRFIDPNGKEIWLYQYDEEGKRVARLQYIPGMEYDGDNAYFASTITTLNQMNSVENGSIILGELHGSENIFGVTNQTSSTGGTRQFVENINGGAIMKMGASFTLEEMAHEMFHGYQHEMGQGGASIFNEVEAYLFGYSVAYEHMLDNVIPLSSSTPMGWKNKVGTDYEKAFKNLLDRFSTEDFKKSVINFKDGSEKNASGAYSNYLLQRENQRESLIKRFYPLIKY